MMASIWANPQFGSGGDGGLRVRGLKGGLSGLWLVVEIRACKLIRDNIWAFC